MMLILPHRRHAGNKKPLGAKKSGRQLNAPPNRHDAQQCDMAVQLYTYTHLTSAADVVCLPCCRRLARRGTGRHANSVSHFGKGNPMDSCTCCARRARCTRLCEAMAARLPSMRKGEMALVDSRVLDALPQLGREPAGTRAAIVQRLAANWSALSPRQREVVELVYFQGLTETAAAGRLGISQPMVFKHRRRALAKLVSGEVMENRE